MIAFTREEAQQVLDALDEYRDSTEDFRVANRCISLIETLRARLSAPEPEPVAWKELTTAETKALWNATKKAGAFAALISAKLKEKNNG